MTPLQKILTVLALIAFAFSLRSIPVLLPDQGDLLSTYAHAWKLRPEHQVNFGALGIRWLGIAVVWGGLMMITGRKSK